MAEAARRLGEHWWNYRRYEKGDREPPIGFVLAAERACGISVASWK
jgi:hypothetical protein